MSTAKLVKKWADEEEDDSEDDQMDTSIGKHFETAPDENGIKTVVEYKERNAQTYKVTRKVKVTKIETRTNDAIAQRKNMQRFGKAAEKNDANLVVQSVEEVKIELSKKHGAPQISGRDDAEDKFLEDSLKITEAMFKEKKAWTSTRRADDSTEAVAAAPPEEKKADETAAAAATGPAAKAKYMPPSLRTAQAAGGKGGKPGDLAGQQQEASLRITNLSEDVREGDLQDLFGQCGQLQRVYLAKDMTTFQSKGFAFITYLKREDAQKAINKLNGHGYDNLILQVNWAKPRV
eukprot:TRINITY_DN2492_c0_g1_i1.p1 TRINITY_DN2492_c0_g1~~TRINITY_DN2492_c0_g1_i1.p1  ORF type:complete len:314 (-),score=83.94 TRINITY_DN2492_c0_g1_i1:149-1021(-)